VVGAPQGEKDKPLRTRAGGDEKIASRYLREREKKLYATTYSRLKTESLTKLGTVRLLQWVRVKVVLKEEG